MIGTLLTEEHLKHNDCVDKNDTVPLIKLTTFLKLYPFKKSFTRNQLARHFLGNEQVVGDL